MEAADGYGRCLREGDVIHALDAVFRSKPKFVITRKGRVIFSGSSSRIGGVRAGFAVRDGRLLITAIGRALLARLE